MKVWIFLPETFPLVLKFFNHVSLNCFMDYLYLMYFVIISTLKQNLDKQSTRLQPTKGRDETNSLQLKEDNKRQAYELLL